jgi:uncharacterized protein YjbI with pentapeptide repeats
MAKDNDKNQIPNYDPDNPRQDHLKFLKECIAEGPDGIAEWNQFRDDNPDEKIWLQRADLKRANLQGANLSKANLQGSILLRVNLQKSCLKNANMQQAFLWKANLQQADLRWVNLKRAKILGANLQQALLLEANLQQTDLQQANLQQALLVSANLKGAELPLANLQQANLYQANLQKTNLQQANLQQADLLQANLQQAALSKANLQQAKLQQADIRGANFSNSDLRATSFRKAIADGQTLIWGCIVNKWQAEKDYTDFVGIGLDSARVQPHIKQLLEYNIRRSNWERWYEDHPFGKWPMKWFWSLTDYAFSTCSILRTFFKYAMVFAVIYYVWGFIDYRFVPAHKDCPGIVSSLFVLEDSPTGPPVFKTSTSQQFIQEKNSPIPVSWWQVPIRSFYFSTVTMTTLGFGDMHAQSNSICGHVLLTLQVLLGYILLGALITRFAVLFTSGGPAGKFIRLDDKGPAKPPALTSEPMSDVHKNTPTKNDQPDPPLPAGKQTW